MYLCAHVRAYVQVYPYVSVCQCRIWAVMHVHTCVRTCTPVVVGDVGGKVDGEAR